MSKQRYLRDDPPSAAELLNQLQELTTEGNYWVCRQSTTGRGWRLHEITPAEAEDFGITVYATAYGALLVAMQADLFAAAELELVNKPSGAGR